MTEILVKELSFAIFGAAMEVFNTLGHGFLEAVYQKALAHKLKMRGIPFADQVRLPVTYKDFLVGEYVTDFIVDGKIIVEIKSVSHFKNEHQAQAMHYLAATGYQLAILLNFGRPGKVEQWRIVR
ncbi:MAG: GxxExxY protein [Chloroflexi bacterium]|nr:GxxExxY protein [Chloroflexota bacterium]